MQLKISFMKKIVVLLTLFASTSLVAQKELEGANIVENGSFESVDGKVRRLENFAKVVGWMNPTAAEADLFMPSNKYYEIDPQTNPYGKEKAKDGEQFAGIVAFSYNNKLPRTYLMAKLNETMLKGQKYCVNFYISLAEMSKYASNNIGAHFSRKAMESTEKITLLDEFDIISFDNPIYNATFNWDKICGTYVAKGGEKYITIGNFETNEATKNERRRKQRGVSGQQIIAAYYYVDNVSVKLLGDDEVCNCESNKNRNLGSTVVYSKNDYFRDDMTLKEKVAASTIYFGFAQENATEASKVDLNRLIDIMKKNPNLKLKVTGHSDVKETELAKEKPNYANMAQKRINATIKFFMDNGIDASRFIPSNAGDRSPSDSEDITDEEFKQAKNRRIEFSVL